MLSLNAMDKIVLNISESKKRFEKTSARNDLTKNLKHKKKFSLS